MAYESDIIKYAKYVAKENYARERAIKVLNLNEKEIELLDSQIAFNMKYSSMGTFNNSDNKGGRAVRNNDYPNELGSSFKQDANNTKWGIY